MSGSMGIFGVMERNNALKEDTLHHEVAALEVLRLSPRIRACIIFWHTSCTFID